MSNLEEIGICRQDNVIVSAWSASEIHEQARQHSYRTLTSANVIIVTYISYISIGNYLVYMIDAMPLFLEVRVCIGTRLKLMNIRTNEART